MLRKKLRWLLPAVVAAVLAITPTASAWDTDSLRVQYDRARSAGWSRILKNVEEQYGLPQGMLFGVASRETLMSNVVADGGHGRGLFQIDDRYHQEWLAAHGAGLPGQVPPIRDAAEYAARILAAHHARAVKEGRHHPWKFALCAYNRGYTGASNGVKDGGTCDWHTADVDGDGKGDYGTDVQARIGVFRAFLNEPKVRTKTVRTPRIQLDARPMVSSHGYHTPLRIVLHSTESGDAAGSVSDMYNIADYWRRAGLGIGAHLTIDGEGFTSLNINPNEIGWHVASRNTGSIGIEQVGYARFTRAQWMARPAQLEKVAKWLAFYSVRFDIPLRFHPERGVTTHAQQSNVAGIPGGHWDPGPGYPLDYVLKLAKKLKKTGW